MDQGGSLEKVSRPFPSHLVGGDITQVAVQFGHHSIQRLSVTEACRLNQGVWCGFNHLAFIID